VSTIAIPAASTFRAGTAAIWRRRLVAVAVLVALAFLLTVAIGRVGAGAELADPVAGHVVVAPGETLWDVAVATAPPGVDVRQQLAALETLNGFTSSDVAAWTVVLIPAR
jgi:Tfp pilus assembly protein FimV